MAIQPWCDMILNGYEMSILTFDIGFKLPHLGHHKVKTMDYLVILPPENTISLAGHQ